MAARGGRPANGIASPYLLTGLLSCGACGGGMFVHRHDHRHHRRFFYACMVYHLRGRGICKNNLESPMEETDQAVLDAVAHDLLRVEVLETALAKALDLLRPGADVLEGTTGRRLRDELAQLDAEVTRLAGAIAAGGELPALLAALQARERRRQQLRTELAALDRVSDRTELDAVCVPEDVRGLLGDWRGLLRQQTPHARQALAALLAGRLVFTPRGEGRERFYEFEGPGTLGKVIGGLAIPTGVVTPAGFEPAISTLKGSRPWPG